MSSWHWKWMRWAQWREILYTRGATSPSPTRTAQEPLPESKHCMMLSQGWWEGAMGVTSSPKLAMCVVFSLWWPLPDDLQKWISVKLIHLLGDSTELFLSMRTCMCCDCRYVVIWKKKNGTYFLYIDIFNSNNWTGNFAEFKKNVVFVQTLITSLTLSWSFIFVLFAPGNFKMISWSIVSLYSPGWL